MFRFSLIILSAALLLSPALPAQAGTQPDANALLKDKPLSKWIEDLKSPDGNVRSQALQVMRKMGPAAREAVPALIAALKEDLSKESRVGLVGDLAATLAAVGPDARAAVPLLVSAMDRDVYRYDHLGFAVLTVGGSAVEEKAAVRGLLLMRMKCVPSALLANEPFLKQHADKIMPNLAELLTDPLPNCRSLVANGLARYGAGARKFSPVLLGALKDKEFDVRIQAALALAVVDPAQKQPAIDALVALLPNSNATYPASMALKQIGADAIPSLLPRLRQNKGEAQTPYIEALAAMGEPVVPMLKKELAGDSVVGRVGAARTLGRLNYAARTARDDLLAALKDPSEEVRFWAAQALVFMDSSKAGPAVPNLIAALESNSASATIRTEAVNTLAILGKMAEPALPALRTALRDSEVRLSAALAMVDIDPRQAVAAVPALQAELERKAAGQPRNVIDALARIGPPAAAAAPALRKALLAENPLSRVAAAWALFRVAPKHTAEAVDALIIEIHQGQALEQTIRALRDIGPPAKSAVPLLKILLVDPRLEHSRIRKDILEAVVKLDPSQTALLLEHIKVGLKSRNRAVFDKAVPQLCDLAPAMPAECAPLLADLLKDPRAKEDWDDVIEVLAKLGPAARPVIPALQERLKDANPDMVELINYAIANINKPARENKAPR
jgi:HEAT repeats